MNPIFRIAKREIALLFNNRTILIFAVVLPFVSFIFFNELLSKGVARDLPVAVVDYDNSAISRTIISQLDATPELQVSFFSINQQKGEDLIKTGKVYGLVTIPKNFEVNLKSGKQVNILNQYNSNVLLPGGLEYKAFNKVIGTISAGAFIQKKQKQGMSFQQALINFQTVNLSNQVLSNPYTNYSYYLNTGFLTYFFQIFVILTTIYCFGIDLRSSKGNRLLRITNGNLMAVIIGKVLPYTIWFYLVGLIMLYSMYVWQDFPLKGNKLAVLVALLLLIFATQSFALLIVSLSNSFRESLTIGSGLAAVSLSFSGITFPVFAMSKIAQWVSQIFPFTHFFRLFLEQSQQGFPVYYTINSFLMLTILSILPTVLAWNNLKKLFVAGVFNHHI